MQKLKCNEMQIKINYKLTQLIVIYILSRTKSIALLVLKPKFVYNNSIGAREVERDELLSAIKKLHKHLDSDRSQLRNDFKNF